jgi:TDG/mug DNA glycosylase family protein
VETIGRTEVFVLPSTSGAARGYWNDSYWHDLAKVAAAHASKGTDSEARKGSRDNEAR